MGLALASRFGGNKKPVRGLIRPLKILWRKGGMYMYVIYHDHGGCIICLVIISFSSRENENRTTFYYL